MSDTEINDTETFDLDDKKAEIVPALRQPKRGNSFYIHLTPNYACYINFCGAWACTNTSGVLVLSKCNPDWRYLIVITLVMNWSIFDFSFLNERNSLFIATISMGVVFDFVITRFLFKYNLKLIWKQLAKSISQLTWKRVNSKPIQSRTT